MDSNKGLLVPINYKGKWRKCVDECWTYDALFMRYVIVKRTRTYMELIDMICAETGISLEDHIIEADCQAIVRFVVPLCVNTSEKPKVHVVPPREPVPIILDKPNVHVDPNQKVSNSVNQPERILQDGEENWDVGLEGIKLSNPVDGFVHNGDVYSLKESIQEEASKTFKGVDNEAVPPHKTTSSSLAPPPKAASSSPITKPSIETFVGMNPTLGTVLGSLKRALTKVANGGLGVHGNPRMEHSYSIDTRFKHFRGTEAIAHMVKDDENGPGDIMDILQLVYGIKISYWKSWKAKEIATQLVRGKLEISFTRLP
ncbi:hypothetical protein LIER_16539 [Lithospermum erythrorhizon]|uniref:Uncharacterized protein n=1 Tax=Lithospermum erythrorhizon TaxID=34254 RepID=A0AAV3Q7V5_LITER